GPLGSLSTKRLRVLELYSGIGGMHYALNLANIPADIVCAIDINPQANEIYNLNHGKLAKHMDISTLTAKDFDAFDCKLWTMSPSCQPFTRIGNRKDILDPRSQAFLNILNVLPHVNNLPEYILIENVQGFEESKAAEECRKVLRNCGYNLIEGILSPNQFNIPNSRSRWYGLARLNFKGEWSIDDVFQFSEVAQKEGEVKRIRDYLEIERDWSSYMVLESVLNKWGHQFDIVKPDSSSCCCFTRGYTHLVQGAGSILQMSDHENTHEQFERNRMALQLRYFTAREVARLMGFPESLEWSKSNVTEKCMYRLLGNSINVKVVSYLISLLLEPLNF
uniref:tRNA (cytosine(38)-C(5))-methyltransferase n=1 Tax=Schizosaccharomyces pombe TaxID=4896 RepID=UPI000DAB39FF|nr:Chain A, tRNA (cytosine(38)-C(5))-methyltransferase [Schizosaccharomyces pombe]6FDF_B Chain B, tRNA (cytosine(38)-C(5))-methyltransferase [Schizosaccharomyces pombe]6FDF_C Chain C, tRNA (cytosine(38)-C(5))-methyltransferase [Schizosaccharomyces pombe]6FDF_D Chain D, tRNA (cytosine(38)-C(5))-methyltransferase [Schizosaccharomyces pombe]